MANSIASAFENAFGIGEHQATEVAMLVQDVGEQPVARVQIVGPERRNVRERQQQSPRAVQQAVVAAARAFCRSTLGDDPPMVFYPGNVGVKGGPR